MPKLRLAGSSPANSINWTSQSCTAIWHAPRSADHSGLSISNTEIRPLESLSAYIAYRFSGNNRSTDSSTPKTSLTYFLMFS